MQCNELRERFTADPRCQDEEALQHLETCDDCTEWLTELQSFEITLSEAMQVEIPEGLEQRLLHRHRPPKKSHVSSLHPILTPHKWHPALALATSLLLVVGLVTSLNDQQPVELFEQQMLSWLSDQQPSQYLDQQASDAEVEGMFLEVGAKLVTDIGTVLHCRITQIGNSKIGYFVLSGEEGPISVMLVADGSRNIIIQGPAGTNSDKIEQQLREAIHWI